MKNSVSVEYQMYIIISCISTGQPSQATQNFALLFLHYYEGLFTKLHIKALAYKLDVKRIITENEAKNAK